MGKKYKMDTAVFKKVVEVNLVGTFIVTKVAVEAMRDKTPLRKQPEFVGFRNSVEGVEEEGGEGREERGVVVNVASLAAFEGQVGQVCQFFFLDLLLFLSLFYTLLFRRSLMPLVKREWLG